MESLSGSSPEKIEMEMVIIRADGTRVPIGRAGFYHKNPVINFFGGLYTRIKAGISIRKANKSL